MRRYRLCGAAHDGFGPPRADFNSVPAPKLQDTDFKARANRARGLSAGLSDSVWLLLALLSFIYEQDRSRIGILIFSLGLEFIHSELLARFEVLRVGFYP